MSKAGGLLGHFPTPREWNGGIDAWAGLHSRFRRT